MLPSSDEQAWFRQRLLPLLGIEASSSAEREELFTAWRRFLEHIAESDPTVLVFEDLHWADDAMLSFLEYLADRAEGVPLVIVGTARPELYERRAEYAAGLRNVNTINLSPLSEEETARLVSALLDASVIPAELQQPILDRAGGNPLYAEEFVRLLKDRDLLVRQGSSWELRAGAEVPFPDSVRALIAARLDTLTPDVKSLLSDAAVVGKVFWAGALAAMGDRGPDGVADALRELSRKELVRSSRRSTIEGEAEFAFWHILTRDVAYAQLPRPSRAARHVAAAEWIESRAPERVEEVADALAYRYATALDLAHATGDTHQVNVLEDPARRFLTLAGERALGLDTAAAMTNLERALALTPPAHPDRPYALARFGKAALEAGRSKDAKEALEDAINTFKEWHDLHGQAHAMNKLSDALRMLGDPRWAELPAEALALLEPLPASPALVEALTEVAATESLQGLNDQAIASAERALTLADQLEVSRPARAVGYRGYSRGSLGDAGALDDMRDAISLATQAEQGREAAILHDNLGILLWAFQGPEAALAELNRGIAYATTRGLAEMAAVTNASTLAPLIDAGRLDQALTLAAALAEHLQDDQSTLAEVRCVQTRIHIVRGRANETTGYLDWIETFGRDEGSADSIVDGLGTAAIAHTTLGNPSHAATLLTEIIKTPNTHSTPYFAAYLPALVRTALTLRRPDLAHALTTDYDPHTPYAHHALITTTAILAEARAEHQTAADGYADATHRWDEFRVVPEQAFALLGQGRCLIHLDQPHQAATVLHQARQHFTQLGAVLALADTDTLLEHATALTS